MITKENNSYVPKYIQIQNYILQKIQDGVLTVGDRIPSEAELSRQFDVSQITVNAVIKGLVSSRVVERIQGKGAFVLSPEKGVGRQSIAFASGIKIAPPEHFSNKPHKLIEHRVIQAGPVLCVKLNLEQDSYVCKVVRCICVDGQANELNYSYIPLSVCSNHTLNCEALEKIFLHNYVCKYFQGKPTHLKIFINTRIMEDMDITSLNIEDQRNVLTWDTFVYKEEKVLAIITMVCASQTNKPFIALEF